MVEVNAAIFQQAGDSCEIGLFAVNIVLARVILEGLARNYEIGVGDDLTAASGLDAVSKSAVMEGGN